MFILPSGLNSLRTYWFNTDPRIPCEGFLIISGCTAFHLPVWWSLDSGLKLIGFSLWYLSRYAPVSAMLWTGSIFLRQSGVPRQFLVLSVSSRKSRPQHTHPSLSTLDRSIPICGRHILINATSASTLSMETGSDSADPTVCGYAGSQFFFFHLYRSLLRMDCLSPETGASWMHRLVCLPAEDFSNTG